MDYFVIHGPTPAEILQRYSKLTGFSPTPPVWSFGLWMSRNSYVSWDVVHTMLPTDCASVGFRPMSCIWIRLGLRKIGTATCDFPQSAFLTPAAHLSQLRDQGFRVSLWQYNFVPPRANNVNYREGCARGLFAKDKAGEVFQASTDRKGSWMDDAIIDFSNPEAAEWYAEKNRRADALRRFEH